MMRRLTQLTAALVVALSFAHLSLTAAQAYVAGGVAKMTLNPSSSTATTGQQFTVQVKLNTGGQTVSGLSARITYPVPATPDLEVVSIAPNNNLGFSFPFTPSSSVSNGKMMIDMAAVSTTGVTNADAVLATITFRANTAFSNKALTFDQSQSMVMRKSDAADILGTLTGGTVTASGGNVTPSTPPAASPTPTPTTSTAVTPTPTPKATPTPTTASTLTTPTPTPTSSTGGSTTDTSATGGVGGSNTTDTRTTATTQTQPLPVSGSAAVTFGLLGVGFMMVLSAVFLKTRGF